ncbi:MAG: S9 family peptidase [Acidimicrobiales bacterium]
MRDSFPRQAARTRRFSLGAPRTFSVSPDGARVLFLRSEGPEDPVTGLWVYEVATGTERHLAGADPDPGGELTAEERGRRERVRETAEGIVAYATDRDHRQVVFTLAGRLCHADVGSGARRPLATTGPVFDPRLDPDGRRVAYCSAGTLRLIGTDGAGDRELIGAEGPEITWGQAEFVAAEEMGRSRGFWWAPDGGALLVARVDESPVQNWWIADPAHPERPPRAHRYPAAGTADASVSLHVVGIDASRVPVAWDREAFPYVVAVSWTEAGPPLALVERRDHHHSQVLRVDPTSGRTAVEREDHDDAWLDRTPGVPAWLADGRLVWVSPSEDTYRLVVAGRAVTPPGLQVRQVIDVADTVLFSASRDPCTVGVWRWDPSGDLEEVAAPTGVAGAAVGGPTAVVIRRDMYHAGAVVEVVGHGTIASRAATPLVTPAVQFLDGGPDALAVGVVLPSERRRGERFPVVMAPYGGPGFQAVMASGHLWLEAQWLADQGFAVVVADGRGTPGRGPAWERRVHLDFASVLDDQVAALSAAAAAVPALDATRVGIRGWSFGGYLSALAVLRRPEVFHAGVAGAPVTDWRLYDTYYTEKYLGQPDDGDAYERSSLLGAAPGLERPLLIIHGLVDDNVVVAHSLRLSEALVAAGRYHSVLPLSGITHMATRPEVAENLLRLQVDFLRRHLGNPA